MQIIPYNKKYSAKVPELFFNTIYNSCKQDYSFKQLEAWAGLSIDYKLWEKRLEETKPFLAIINNQLVGFAEFYNDYIDCFYVDYKFQKKRCRKSTYKLYSFYSKAKKY